MSITRVHKNLSNIFKFLKSNRADIDVYNSYLELESYISNLQEFKTRILDKISNQEDSIEKLLNKLDDNKSKNK